MTEPLMDRRRAGELLREADCPEAFIQRLLTALELAPAEELLCMLRCQRCRQLERVHEEQRKLDGLDRLRYELEKLCREKSRQGEGDGGC